LLQSDGEAHRRICGNLARIAAGTGRWPDAILVGSAFDAVVELDERLRVLRWRSHGGRGDRIFAGHGAAAAGTDLRERAPVLARAVLQHAAPAREKTTPIVFTLELDGGGGTRHLELTLGSPGAGSGWVLGIRDRTDLRLLEERLIRAEKLALAGRMSVEIGHDLRNLLAGATSLSELLRADPSIRELPEAARTVDLLAGQLARMQRFALGLLDLGRTGARRERVDLNALVERLAGFLEGQSRFRSVELQRHLDPALPALSLDPGQIQQVLLNLYANAVDALDGRRGGRIRTVTRGPRDGDPVVVLAVEDNGPGMTPEVRVRAFEPAFTTRDSGHGFGLAISRRIARSHGGTLQAEEAPGEGARLVLRLPIPR
jgi:signal transduction histidine kinase